MSAGRPTIRTLRNNRRSAARDYSARVIVSCSSLLPALNFIRGSSFSSSIEQGLPSCSRRESYCTLTTTFISSQSCIEPTALAIRGTSLATKGTVPVPVTTESAPALALRLLQIAAHTNAFCSISTAILVSREPLANSSNKQNTKEVFQGFSWACCLGAGNLRNTAKFKG